LIEAAMDEEQTPFHTTKTIRGFSRTCSAVFDVALAAFGFQLRTKQRGRRFHAHLYRRDSASHVGPYIEVFADTHCRDTPNYVGITLGEGSDAMPERDWNGIALWQFIQHYDPERVQKSPGDLYGLRYVEESQAVLEQAAQDLFTDARDFLSGDLSLFRRIRAELNQERDPYRWHIPDPGTGKYRVLIDEESRRLKERFSSEAEG
jgi:hypothetical protein